VIACYGITYKPDVDDVRESPALDVVRQIAASGVEVLVCEPNLHELPAALIEFPQVRLVDTTEAETRADIAVFLVQHKRFARFDTARFMHKVVVDAIGLLSRPAVRVD
jgi:UDP-N-acetyl-D-mannosaminuronic acid dehydrogenase